MRPMRAVLFAAGFAGALGAVPDPLDGGCEKGTCRQSNVLLQASTQRTLTVVDDLAEGNGTDDNNGGDPPLEVNVDYPKNDLNMGGWRGRVPGHLADAAACRQACLDNAACVGYSFVKNEKTGDNCAVKAQWVASTRKENPCCDSQQITSLERYPPLEVNVDYPKNDLNAGGRLGRVPGHLADAAACRQACLANAACVGYSFVKNEKTGDNCAVKAQWVASTRTPNPCCDSQRIGTRVTTTTTITTITATTTKTADPRGTFPLW